MEPLEAGDPRTVGPYVLIARLGSGGMGQVFLGRTRGGRTVAVKVVKAELAGDREFRRRFRQEVAAVRLVSGRYTAAVVDADPDAPMPWLATAYVSGLTLRAVVSGGARLPESSLRVLAYGLARALAEIHAAGVVHRDLKPSNVMLAVDGPHVIDFGISRVIAAADLTRTDVGTIIGSPGFMSPEQTRGQELTPATDVFSLGTVLAYAATGRNPFGGGPDHTLLYRIAHDEPDLSGLPPSLAPLIATCLAKEPERRPSTAQIIGRMADTPGGNAWLPAELTAAIAQSAAEILDYEGIAVFPQPDNDALTRAVPPPDPTLVLPTSADRPTEQLGDTGERTVERIGIGEPPEGKHGGGGAGWVAGVLSVAVIAALATALVLVLRSGSHNPSPPPSASVGTTSSQSPLTRSVSGKTSSQSSTTAPSPTTGSPPAPTTPVSTSSTTGVPSPTTSSTTSTTQSTSAPSTPSSTSSPSSAPSSSPSAPHSSASHSSPPASPSPSHS
ncbi:serine/threonine protein kinase [Catenulispora sp. NL8]|uniref:non-specific serine/threonine protein kinase n=1 Tax=Catenulispora pinistramenti TaxID=2705254 RepID=A0ABS5L563_9ACTN|nr:serine/threonine-protein kinase [Catenulispora pinistramenti]MBS2553367.1 serine/threonine protein kinase [Catenulispora pinistramenti]